MQNSSNNNKRFSLKEIRATFDSKGNIKNNKKSNFWPKLVSVLAALFLWLYVFQAVEDEVKINGVSIALENFNTNLGLDIVSGFEGTIDVTLSGTKSTISEISSDDIKATVDLAEVTSIGSYVLDVQLEVPATTKVVEKSVSQIKIAVDKKANKEILITPMINYNIQYPYELGKPVLSHSSVKLEGPETDILAVAKANVELNLGNVKNNIVSNSKIVLYNADDYVIDSKYITIEPAIVEVKIPVIKTDRFYVTPDITIDRERFDYSISPQSVYIKGEVNDVEAMSALRTEKMQISSAGEYELALLLSENIAAYTAFSSSQEDKVMSVKLTVTEKKPVQNHDK